MNKIFAIPYFPRWFFQILTKFLPQQSNYVHFMMRTVSHFILKLVCKRRGSIGLLTFCLLSRIEGSVWPLWPLIIRGSRPFIYPHLWLLSIVLLFVVFVKAHIVVFLSKLLFMHHSCDWSQVKRVKESDSTWTVKPDYSRKDLAA